MAKPASIQVAVGAVAAVALLGAAAGLSWVRETRFPPPPPAKAALYVTSGNAARHLSKGYNAVAADLYWIRTIQYYGDLKLRLAREGGADVNRPDVDRFEL